MLWIALLVGWLVASVLAGLLLGRCLAITLGDLNDCDEGC